MAMRCCTSSSLGGYFVLGAGCFVAGVLGARAFEASPVTQAVEPASPFTGQVINAGFTQPEAEMTPEMMMAFMKEWAAPVEQHEVLAKMAGSFECKTSFSMGGPEMTESTGTSELETILGGRYVAQHFVMPEFMGMEFEGMGAIGYDKSKDKFVNVWIDSMSTGMMFLEGEYDEDTDTMTWHGDAVEPGPAGAMTVPVKHVIKNATSDHSVMEFWRADPMNGEMMKSGTIEYHRK